MHQIIQDLLNWYLDKIDQFGLFGVVILMAMESSIFPVPSELVIPPAAYLECHMKGGHPLLILAVIAAGTIGSYLGSAITYCVARIVGRPLIVKFGKYIFIPEKKLKLAEEWVASYGAGGIFIARLLPVVRHLISIPAGMVGMRFSTFSVMTIFGSAIWCTVLTFFGLAMANDLKQVLQDTKHAESPAYQAAFHNLTLATLAMVAVVTILYIVVLRWKKRAKSEPEAEKSACGK